MSAARVIDVSSAHASAATASATASATAAANGAESSWFFGVSPILARTVAFGSAAVSSVAGAVLRLSAPDALAVLGVRVAVLVALALVLRYVARSVCARYRAQEISRIIQGEDDDDDYSSGDEYSDDGNDDNGGGEGVLRHRGAGGGGAPAAPRAGGTAATVAFDPFVTAATAAPAHRQ